MIKDEDFNIEVAPTPGEFSEYTESESHCDFTSPYSVLSQMKITWRCKLVGLSKVTYSD